MHVLPARTHLCALLAGPLFVVICCAHFFGCLEMTLRISEAHRERALRVYSGWGGEGWGGVWQSGALNKCLSVVGIGFDLRFGLLFVNNRLINAKCIRRGCVMLGVGVGIGVGVGVGIAALIWHLSFIYSHCENCRFYWHLCRCPHPPLASRPPPRTTLSSDNALGVSQINSQAATGPGSALSGLTAQL